MAGFLLDSTLENDTLAVGQLPLCRVLLMDDRRFPWLILVPMRAGLREIIDLDATARAVLMEEITATSNALQACFNPDKLNVAALGNMVPQLHVHIIARFVSDAAWPKPIFGVGVPDPYPAHMAGSMVDRIFKALKPAGILEMGT